jgi:5-methyltetrahydropteroyltriglutamate--homocysteine methyltransferase
MLNFLRKQTNKPIKWALPGPLTMVDTLSDNYYKSKEKLAWNLQKHSMRKQENCRVDIIQFDEPAFNV